jgi:hypothetical protein
LIQNWWRSVPLVEMSVEYLYERCYDEDLARAEIHFLTREMDRFPVQYKFRGSLAAEAAVPDGIAQVYDPHFDSIENGV